MRPRVRAREEQRGKVGRCTPIDRGALPPNPRGLYPSHLQEARHTEKGLPLFREIALSTSASSVGRGSLLSVALSPTKVINLPYLYLCGSPPFGSEADTKL